MEIYFININKFTENIELDSLKYFLEDKTFGSQKREKEFCLGRFLLKYVLKTRYNIINPQIITKNKKPRIQSDKINFSLTHSHGIVMAAFSNEETGIDLELMKERNFEKLFDFYNISTSKKDKQTFYQLWTEYEAKIKLQQIPKSSLSGIFQKNYSLSICLSKESDIIKTLKIYELKIPTQRTNPNELINLKLVIESKKNENTVVAQEIKTADSLESEFLPLSPLNLKIE